MKINLSLNTATTGQELTVMDETGTNIYDIESCRVKKLELKR